MLGREALLALILTTTAFAAAPTAAADPLCAVPWGVASSAPLQDDAESGGDAADDRADALVLPGHGDYPAFLDPLYRDAADAVDWYALSLADSGVDGIFSVSADYAAHHAADAARPVFRLDVYRPGDLAPSATTTSDGSPVVVPLDTAGTWHIRVSVEDPMPFVYVCGQGAAFATGTGIGGATSRIVQNHVVYFGCDPICAPAA